MSRMGEYALELEEEEPNGEEQQELEECRRAEEQQLLLADPGYARWLDEIDSYNKHLPEETHD